MAWGGGGEGEGVIRRSFKWGERQGHRVVGGDLGTAEDSVMPRVAAVVSWPGGGDEQQGQRMPMTLMFTCL
jgi:hypothetical protein